MGSAGQHPGESGARPPRLDEGWIVFRTTARHRKPSRAAPAGPGRRRRPIRAAVAVAVGSALLASAWLAAAHSKALGSGPAALSQADMLGPPSAGSYRDLTIPRLAAQSAQISQPRIIGTAVVSRGRQSRAGGPAAGGSGYLNPLRAVSGLVPERVDEGVDFSGSGPVYALGDAVITNAGQNAGWPGGGWITYRLTGGPAAGLMVYLAEDVTPTVQAGQRVSPTTVIANMFNGGDGIETGWAQPTGVSAESELPEAGGISGGGPFPTMIGINFDALLQYLGVPAAPNAAQTAYGLLPANYPPAWR